MEQVDLGDGDMEEVRVDPVQGPMIRQQDGYWGVMGSAGISANMCGHGPKSNHFGSKKWSEMTSTEQKLALHTAAKKSRNVRQWADGIGGYPGSNTKEYFNLIGMRGTTAWDRLSREERRAWERGEVVMDPSFE